MVALTLNENRIYAFYLAFEVIAEYIQLQSRQKLDRDDDFTIDGIESSSDDQV